METGMQIIRRGNHLTVESKRLNVGHAQRQNDPDDEYRYEDFVQRKAGI